MTASHPSGTPEPTRHVLDLYLDETRQLFNFMDPAPFRKRDLDPQAEAYILEWAREAPSRPPLGLVVHLGRETPTPEAEAMLREAVGDHFRRSARTTWTSLRRLFRQGRIALVVGLAFLLLAIVVGESVASRVDYDRHAVLIQESLIIVGWVALWHPLGIFLYDWWPIRAEARLLDRLGEMQVTLVETVDSPGMADRPAR